MANEDRERVRQSVQGDTEAFRQLVGRYANAVFAAAYARLGNPHDAEDVAQEVFVKAWYNLSRLEEPEKFGSWLMSITRHTAEDWARKLKPAQGFEEAMLIGNSANFTEESVLRREQRQIVRAALEGLDEKYRQVTTLYYIGGYNAREIATLSDVSVSLVESRLRRAKAILKKELVALAEQTMTDQALGTAFVTKVMRRITGLACINLPVRNVDVSARWYVEQLGVILLREPTRFEQGANAIIQLGEHGPSVLMHEEEELTPLHFTRNGKPAPIFELRTDDADAFYAQLLEQGATVTNRYDNAPCGKYFHVHDPDGNVITIVE
ncbi:sigma-70 family RNA polymerase sigma factor [Paenibacillus rhizovicinus]|uniref:RNA polymerase sigma factor n=1 Tax=Paenibacillus rhizovicinus TaxID=2704463 RepID=A0A6C0NZU8_9BACL|nr:sigma-70 family RNA polymerase sigma factor [Paenibacillus rhizovicinus]QHW31729.1 sigma-70 family RNA polymerase sigma factor [Paenibacillus rhizovicinus]